MGVLNWLDPHAVREGSQVCTACDRVRGQLAQVLAWLQDDRLDVALPAKVD